MFNPEDENEYDYIEDEEEFKSCHIDYTDEYHDCLNYMECDECPYYYDDYDEG